MSDNIKKIEENIKNCYSTWGDTYYNDYYKSSTAYPAVHIDIIKKILSESNIKSIVDAGCGPASILRHLFELNYECYGFDLTSEMIDEAKRICLEEKIDPGRVWLGSVINRKDFFGQIGPKAYDAALCIGVLPHIPEEYDEVVIQNLYNSINSEGIVILEARNKFFSLFTHNRHSYEFITNDLIDIENLFSEDSSNTEKLRYAFESFKSQFYMDLPPVRKGKSGELGYDEVLSRTHNPFILTEQIQKSGFREPKLYFYHYHAMPPFFEKEFPQFFRMKSLEMENALDWRGYFMASAFLITGKK